MARTGSFVITGLKEIDKALRELDAAIGKKIVRQSMRKALKPVQKAVEANAPVGESGLLADSVKIRAGKRKKNSIRINVHIGKESFPDAYYFYFVEFDTVQRPGQHFMERAFEATGEAAKAQAIDEIWNGINAELRK